jgi:hypothetical protein
MVDETGKADVAEPFGYSGLVGCTYFKYGIYRDSQPELGHRLRPLRRGATRQSVESPAP